jgi:hypothetical protein
MLRPAFSQKLIVSHCWPCPPTARLLSTGGAAKGNPVYTVMGVTRFWRYTKDKMNELIKAGRVIQTSPGTVPPYKRYLDEMPGVPLQDIWTDLKPLGAQAQERLGSSRRNQTTPRVGLAIF